VHRYVGAQVRKLVCLHRFYKLIFSRPFQGFFFDYFKCLSAAVEDENAEELFLIFKSVHYFFVKLFSSKNCIPSFFKKSHFLLPILFALKRPHQNPALIQSQKSLKTWQWR
jgi:hypothetical protein